MASIIGGLHHFARAGDRRRHRERQAERGLTGSRSSISFRRCANGSRARKPDVAVIFYNDHGLGHFLDKMPTFAIGCAAEYKHADEGWGLPDDGAFAGDAKLSWHIAESLVADEFDSRRRRKCWSITRCKIPLGSASIRPQDFPVRAVPITINSIQHPLPTPKRCWDLGRAVGRAIRAYSPRRQGAGHRFGWPVASTRRRASWFPQ